MKYLFIVLALTGCAQSGYSASAKPTETQYVRDVNGRTVYRITDGNVYNTSGQRVARIGKK